MIDTVMQKLEFSSTNIQMLSCLVISSVSSPHLFRITGMLPSLFSYIYIYNWLIYRSVVYPSTLNSDPDPDFGPIWRRIRIRIQGYVINWAETN